MDPQLRVGDLVVPEQLIDYTWGRQSSFDDELRHIEFSQPYDAKLAQQVLAAGGGLDVRMVGGGVYGCTQGPRLETAAEIKRLSRDGCTLVGMTAMPEAALCRELEIPMANVSLVVNPAAGVSAGVRGEQPIDLGALRLASQQGAQQMRTLLSALADEFGNGLM